MFAKQHTYKKAQGQGTSAFGTGMILSIKTQIAEVGGHSNNKAFMKNPKKEKETYIILKRRGLYKTVYYRCTENAILNQIQDVIQ